MHACNACDCMIWISFTTSWMAASGVRAQENLLAGCRHVADKQTTFSMATANPCSLAWMPSARAQATGGVLHAHVHQPCYEGTAATPQLWIRSPAACLEAGLAATLAAYTVLRRLVLARHQVGRTCTTRITGLGLPAVPSLVQPAYCRGRHSLLSSKQALPRMHLLQLEPHIIL